MLEFKRFPEPVPISKDGTVTVIGWAGKRSFVVNSKLKLEKGASKSLFNLDGSEGEDDGDILSLWDWAKQNQLSVGDLDDLQERLETYIEIDGEMI